MRLHGVIAIGVAGETLLRRPGVWDKLKSAFGGTPDLRTGKQKAALESTAVVTATRDALRRLGVTNAVSLLVDDLVLFQDKEGRRDDLDDLVGAFREHEVAIGGEFTLLRLTVEHEEAGLHIVMEVQATPIHATEDTAARVVVSARVKDLEPRPGEDAETYRARAEPIARDQGRLEVSRAQFESFVDRAKDAIAAAMPEARVKVLEAQALVERPTRDVARARGKQRAPKPTSRAYDPYMAYYPHPLESVAHMMMWSSILSWGHSPHYTVVDHHGHELGSMDDPGFDASAGADADGFFDGTDEAGFDGGGGDFESGGGDFDGGGGDFDGGGFEGGDFGDFGGGDW